MLFTTRYSRYHELCIAHYACDRRTLARSPQCRHCAMAGAPSAKLALVHSEEAGWYVQASQAILTGAELMRASGIIVVDQNAHIFCSFCGAEAARSCPDCGAVQFCTACSESPVYPAIHARECHALIELKRDVWRPAFAAPAGMASAPRDDAGGPRPTASTVKPWSGRC